MFSENLRILRKNKGLSQEELAIRLNVVRQTVSKWEKGLSVPDADTLVRLSDTLEESVSVLLGATIENEKEANDIAEQLSRINEQLAIKNRRASRIWKVVAILFAAFIIIPVLLIILSIPIAHRTYMSITHEETIVVEEEVIESSPSEND